MKITWIVLLLAAVAVATSKIKKKLLRIQNINFLFKADQGPLQGPSTPPEIYDENFSTTSSNLLSEFLIIVWEFQKENFYPRI